jgi:xylulokinase
VNAFHTLARTLWVKEEEPQIFEKIDWVLEPKDYVNFRLTGEPAADKISLSRIISVSGEGPAAALFQAFGLPVDLFPPLREPTAILGKIRAGLEAPLERLAGVPVFVGGMDAWCGTLGVGALRAGRIFNSSGTTEVLCALTGTYRETPGLVTLPWGQGLFQTGGPSQSGTDCLTWFLQAFGGGGLSLDPGEALGGLEGMERQAEPVLFYPYLRGERTPLWEPDLRALFLGLNRRHGRTDCLWAVLEGVAFANRQVLELAIEGESGAFDEVRITGGAAASDLWCQVKADVLKRPVVRTRWKEAAVLGAAMVALIGLGDYAGIEECEERLVAVERVFEPRPNRGAAYDRLYRRWIEGQKNLLPVTLDLTRDAREGVTFLKG